MNETRLAILNEVLNAQQEEKDRIAKRYQYNLDNDCADMTSNSDWARLEGSVRTIDVVREMIRKESPLTEKVLRPEDLKVSTVTEKRCGFSVIKEGVMVTHVPTGITAKSIEQRSAHYNRRIAMELIAVKLEEAGWKV